MNRAILPIAILLLTAALTACGDNGASNPTATPSATSTSPTATPAPDPSSSPTPTPSLGPGVIQLTRGPDAPFPDDMAFIIETGCFACEGYATGLVRLYRDPSGQIRVDNIFDPIAMGYPPYRFEDADGQVNEHTPFLSGPVTSPDHSVIAMGVCIKHECGDGGLFGWNADAESVILRSFDGGVTWEEVARGGPVLQVAAVQDDGTVLTVNYTDAFDGVSLPPAEFRLFPGGEAVTPPDRYSGYPLVTAFGRLLWPSADGTLLHTDGIPFIESPDPDFAVVTGYYQPSADRLLVSWSLGGSVSDRERIIMYKRNGEEIKVTKTFITEQFTLLGWGSQDRAAITIDVPPPPIEYGRPIPALLDFATGEYRPITEGFASDEPPYAPYGRTYVRVVQIGPFARVTGTDSCLNIRTEPSITAQVLYCAADGVLLTDSGETSGNWVSVTTPGGVEGWASATYLER